LWVYFTFVQPFPFLSLTSLLPTPQFSTVFNTHPYILYLHRGYVGKIVIILW
jgi:hypothetical protein